jgi:hypothetical protein
LAAAGDQGIKLAHDPQAWKGRISDQGQAFAREVVDNRQDAEPPAVGERIRQKV